MRSENMLSNSAEDKKGKTTFKRTVNVEHYMDSPIVKYKHKLYKQKYWKPELTVL